MNRVVLGCASGSTLLGGGRQEMLSERVGVTARPVDILLRLFG